MKNGIFINNSPYTKQIFFLVFPCALSVSVVGKPLPLRHLAHSVSLRIKKSSICKIS